MVVKVLALGVVGHAVATTSRSGMRVFLEEWILGDGQMPEPAVGDTLRGIGLWLTCRSSSPSAGADSMQMVEPGGAEWATDSVLDGEVVLRREDPEAAIVRVGEHLFVVQGEWKEFGDPAPHEDPVDLRVVPVGLPGVGERICLVGSFRVMAEHEFHKGYRFGSGMPDVRANWEVSAIHRERYARYSDRIIDVTPLERIDTWADLDEPVMYVLDLVPSDEPYAPPPVMARLHASLRDSMIPLRLRLYYMNQWFRRHWPWGRHFAG
jgi:hypothetical protein